jgi:hypothetical protein
LYVGARTNRFDFGEAFKNAGCAITILEAFRLNVEYLRTIEWLEDVIEGDVRIFKPCKTYEVTFWWHGPEHVDIKEIPDTLKLIESYTTELVVLGCPWGVYEQGEAFGNPYETHRSYIYPETFEALGYTVECLGARDVRGSNITAVKLLNQTSLENQGG